MEVYRGYRKQNEGLGFVFSFFFMFIFPVLCSIVWIIAGSIVLGDGDEYLSFSSRLSGSTDGSNTLVQFGAAAGMGMLIVGLLNVHLSTIESVMEQGWVAMFFFPFALIYAILSGDFNKRVLMWTGPMVLALAMGLTLQISPEWLMFPAVAYSFRNLLRKHSEKGISALKTIAITVMTASPGIYFLLFWEGNEGARFGFLILFVGLYIVSMWITNLRAETARREALSSF